MMCNIFNGCENNATCYKFSGRDNFFCKCLPLWTGKTCNISQPAPVIDYCAGNPCKNSAHCENEGDSFSCVCGSAFTGSDCSQEIQCEYGDFLEGWGLSLCNFVWYHLSCNWVATSQLNLNSLTFLAHFSLTFPDPMTQIWWVSRDIPSEARKNFAPATTGLLQKYA